MLPSRCITRKDLPSPGRRGFLRTCVGAVAGLGAFLTVGLGTSWKARSWPLEPSLGLEEILLVGQVVTLARGTTGVAPKYADGAVLVRQGRIAYVGPRIGCPTPDRGLQLDLGGLTLLPGIIDAHTHETMALKVRQALLAQGVTSVGNVGSSLADLSLLTDQQGMDNEPLTGVYATGPMIGPVGGYPGCVWPQRYGLPVGDVQSAQQAAKLVLDRGASMLKIGFEPGPDPATPWPMLGLGAAKAVVQVAHERGAVVRCHVQDLSALDLAIRAGVDCVEHTVLRSAQGPVFTGARGELVPVPAYAAQLCRLADKGILLVPTLQMAARADWDGSGGVGAVRCFCNAGGKVALGTDAPMRGVKHGMPLEEMRLLRLAGLSHEEVLRAATVNGARALGQSAQMGSIEPGKQADLIAVAGDPGNDVAILGQVGMVMKAGKRLRERVSSS